MSVGTLSRRGTYTVAVLLAGTVPVTAIGFGVVLDVLGARVGAFFWSADAQVGTLVGLYAVVGIWLGYRWRWATVVPAFLGTAAGILLYQLLAAAIEIMVGMHAKWIQAGLLALPLASAAGALAASGAERRSQPPGSKGHSR